VYGRSSEVGGRCRVDGPPAADDGDGWLEKTDGDGSGDILGGGKVGSTELGMTIGIWNVLANDSIAAIDSWLATPSIAKIPLATVRHSAIKSQRKKEITN